MADLLSIGDAIERATLYNELADAYDARNAISEYLAELRPKWAEVIARVAAAEAKVRAFEAGEDV